MPRFNKEQKRVVALEVFNAVKTKLEKKHKAAFEVSNAHIRIRDWGAIPELYCCGTNELKKHKV